MWGNQMQNVRINIERLKKNLVEVNHVANGGSVGYTRLAFSKEEKAALDWLQGKLQQLNVEIQVDRIGNVFGRSGSKSERAIAFGSHLDTVQNGGFYDGSLGVVIGLECLQTILENGGSSFPIELVCFVAEEAYILGGTFGSRAVAGSIPYTDKFNCKSEKLNYSWEETQAVKLSGDRWKSFLELHIEQGTVLEKSNKQIGIVTGIAGILRLSVTVKGRASHSGTTPMDSRQDALVDASTLILEVNRLANSMKSQIVATVGEINVRPNSANVVPDIAELTIEVRSEKWEEIQKFETEIRKFIKANLNASINIGVQKYPSKLSEFVQKNIEMSCQRLSIPYQHMVSGANHDANSLTALTDVGMIFVPSKGGVSHHHEEFTNWEDIEAGANVMLQTILNL